MSMRSTYKANMSKKRLYFDTFWPHVDVIDMKPNMVINLAFMYMNLTFMYMTGAICIAFKVFYT